MIPRRIKKSMFFDKEWYLSQNPDVQASGANPLKHYIKFGWKEGRNPSKEFDGNAYLQANKDVLRDEMNPLLHYEKFGKREGRKIYGSCDITVIRCKRYLKVLKKITYSNNRRHIFLLGIKIADYVRKENLLQKIERLQKELANAKNEAKANTESLQKELANAKNEAKANTESLQKELANAKNEIKYLRESFQQELISVRQNIQQEFVNIREETKDGKLPVYSKKIKKVVYTCITGGYDNILEYTYVSTDWDYILFTDNEDLIEKGKIYHWNVKPLQFNKLTNVKNARWHKVNAHILLPDYDYSLWVDANISIENKTPFELFDNLVYSNIKVSIPLHPQRKCIYEEAETIKKLLIDYQNIVDSETEFLIKENYPKANGLSETNIMFRKHNDAQIVAAQNLWWQMIKEYSKRDQLSCNYVFWKKNIVILPLYQQAGYHRRCEEFKFYHPPTHNQDKIKISSETTEGLSE